MKQYTQFHQQNLNCIELEFTSEFLICFEAWAKLAQQWLVCAPLEIHLKPISKELMLLVTI